MGFCAGTKTERILILHIPVGVPNEVVHKTNPAYASHFLNFISKDVDDKYHDVD